MSSLNSKPSRRQASKSFRIGKVRAHLRGQIWYLCYREQGRRRQPRVGPDRAAAQQMAAEINAQLEVGLPSALGFEPTSIPELQQRWLDHHEYIRRSSVRTIERYRAATNHLLRFVEDECPIRRVDVRPSAYASSFQSTAGDQIRRSFPPHKHPAWNGVHHECVVNVSRLKPICERYGMPLMVEPLVMQANATAGGYMVDGDVQKIVSLVRQAVELGADIIKADPCDDVDEYHLVVEAAGHCPVLPRGGGRVPTDEVLRRTKALMAQGASGIVYGRNIIQHENPRGMTQALMAIVHKDATVEQALELLHQSPSLASSQR